MLAINTGVVRQTFDGLPLTMVSELMATFEVDVQRLAQNMIQAAAVEDLAAYRFAAHALAGTTGSLGACDLAALARAAMHLEAADAEMAQTLTEASVVVVGQVRVALGIE